MNGRVLSLLLGMSFLGGWSECPLARQLEAPGAPLGFHATATSPTTIDLAWDRDYSVYDYHMSRDPSGMVGSWMLGGSETSYSDTYLTPGTTYTYQIFGENNAGTGPGATASATTFFPDAGAVSDGGAPPPAPTGFTATATSSSTIHLSWNTPLVDATGLILERQDAGAFDEIAQPPVTEAFYDDEGLAASSTYFYRLRATNSVGASPGVVASAMTLPSTSGSVVLTWTIFGADPRADAGQACGGFDRVFVQVGGQDRTAPCSAGTLQIDGVPAGTSSLDAVLYFAGGDGGEIADQRTLSPSVSSGQVTQVNIDFHPV